MPRYELVDEKSKKFWEITLASNDVTARWGRIGTDGQTKTKSFDGPDDAQKDYDKQVAGKLKKGYSLVENLGASSRARAAISNSELEAIIRQAPDDVDGYLVYGDWLQSEGSPHGELVAIQHALAQDPDNDMLRASEAELLKVHTEYFFGPEQPGEDAAELAYEAFSDWERPHGWAENAGWQYGYARSVWKNGFINGLVFNTGYYDDDEEHFSKDAGEVLAGVLALPASGFIQRIGIGEVWMQEDYEGPDTTVVIEAIAAAPCATTLREFAVRGGDHDLNGVSLDATALWRACPNLEIAVLYAGQLTFGAIDAPKVRRFAVRTGGLDKDALKSITAASWPALKDLEIWFGNSRYGANCDIRDLEPLLQRSDLKLERLGLMNMEFGDDLCEALVRSPLLEGLTTLDLSMGIIGDEGARALIESKEKLAHIGTIRVSGYFSGAVAEELKSIGNDVQVFQRGEPDANYRYVEVGE